MNTPYVKQYENGTLINPINGSYISHSPNRRARRFKNSRPFNNRSKTAIAIHHDATSGKVYAFKEVVQNILGKVIVRYIDKRTSKPYSIPS